MEAVGPSRLILGNYATPPPLPTDIRRRIRSRSIRPEVAHRPRRPSRSAWPRSVMAWTSPFDRCRRRENLSAMVQGPPEASPASCWLMPAGLEDLPNGAEAATTLVAGDGRFGILERAAARMSSTRRARRSNSHSQAGRMPARCHGAGPRREWVAEGSVTSARPARVTSGDRDAATTSTGRRRRSPWDRRTSRTSSSRSRKAQRSAAVWSMRRRAPRSNPSRSRAGARRPTPAQTVQTTTTTPKPDRTPTIYAEPADGSPSLGLPRSVRCPTAPAPRRIHFASKASRAGELM